MLITTLFSTAHASDRPGHLADGVNPGSLSVVQLGGEKPPEKLEMPLQHTDVQIEVSGFLARAKVTQAYHNPFTKPIEAVYTFPLPEDAAVDDMSMTIGNRTIKGAIKRRDEARKIYEKAREQGQRASLLEQERPNIFTQAVANIMPGDNIIITIQYVDILDYSEGNYELVFPMVVGPRYIPDGETLGKSGTGWSPDVKSVPDASKITPPVLKPGQRTGHDISLAVKLDAGVPVQGLNSTSHVIDTANISSNKKEIKLHPADTIPNKDFILRYAVAGQAPEMAVIPHYDARGGFFTLIIQPQREVTDNQTVPRELIFIVDTSGSMQGFPMEKSKEAMWKLIKGMRTTDTFNVVRFAGDTGTLWPTPQPYNAETSQEANKFIEGFQGSGGTEMQLGIIEALSQPAAEGKLRIAFLLTDGYVGNETDIFQAIEKERRGARVFTLGVGSSVNRHLLDRSAVIGRGEAFYVRQDEDSKAVIDKFFSRVDRPSLAYININWGNLDVEQMYPAKVPDLWAGQPIQITGRYQRGGTAEIVVTGQLGQKSYQQKLQVNLPSSAPAHEAIASVWARKKVQSLMDDMVTQGEIQTLIDEVTQVGLTFRLMTRWTSFVAVEERVVNVEGKPQTVVQPVELPEGVSYEGIFGEAPEAQPVPSAKGFALPSFVAPSSRMDGGATRGAPASADMASAPLPAMEERKAAPAKSESSDKPKELRAPIQAKESILFQTGQSALTEAAKQQLDRIAEVICRELNSQSKQLPDIKQIRITGHADSSPGDNYKQKLSLERATVVADYLLNRCKLLKRDLLVIKGEADKMPSAPNDTEEGRTQNRRVEVEFVF